MSAQIDIAPGVEPSGPPPQAAGGSENVRPRPSRRARLGTLASLAWPVVLTRAGILLMALADIVMVGRYDPDELAYAALGNALYIVVLVTGIGLSMGVLTLTSQAFGAGDRLECGRVFRRGLAWAAAIGALGGLLVASGEFWLSLIGHDPALAREGGAVAFAIALGLPTGMLHVVCSFHLESTRRPQPGLVAMAIANVVNVGLNAFLIYGLWGAPELGAVGAAITTATVRTLLFVALFAYILTRLDRADYGLDRLRGDQPTPGIWGSRFWGPGGWRASASLRRLGFSAGVGLMCETSAYFALTQFAGFIGAGALAAYAIGHNVEAVVFMAALGVASATAVMVGNAIGAGDRGEAAAAGWTGLAAVRMATGAAALALWAFPGAVAGIYAEEPGLAAA
ncbi:MAG: MATE family efflux transporter, partial [Pseudomonadota bacterium]